jgi:hypothetical protein
MDGARTLHKFIPIEFSDLLVVGKNGPEVQIDTVGNDSMDSLTSMLTIYN